MALVHWQAAVRRHERWAHEFIEQALWPPIRDVLHLRQPRGIVRIAAFAKGFSRATSSGARLQIAAPGAAAGSAMRVQGVAQAPGLKTRTPSFARPPTS